MFKEVSIAVTLAAAICTGCPCEQRCDDSLRLIPEAAPEAGGWPPTNSYQIEVDVDGSKFECDGYFKAEGDDVWTCSEGVEAHSRFGWKTPIFVIDQTREQVGELETVHVKIWREDVLVFDDDEPIQWQRVNDASTDDEPCGCWAGVLRVSIESFEGLDHTS